MNELQKIIKEKIDELSFAQYEGVINGLIIIVVDKGSFKILPAYDNNSYALLNTGLDIAKNELMILIRSNATVEIRDIKQ